MAVGSERAWSAPAPLTTRSRTRSAPPASAASTVYVRAVAPAISLHAPAGVGQRNQAHVACGAGSPVTVAFAVSDAPTCGVPAIVGPEVIRGAVAARATSAASAAKHAAAVIATQRRRRAGRGPSIDRRFFTALLVGSTRRAWTKA